MKRVGECAYLFVSGADEALEVIGGAVVLVDFVQVLRPVPVVSTLGVWRAR